MTAITIKFNGDVLVLSGGGPFDGKSVYIHPLSDGTLRVSAKEVRSQKDAFGGVIQAEVYETLSPVVMTLEEIIAKLR